MIFDWTQKSMNGYPVPGLDCKSLMAHWQESWQISFSYTAYCNKVASSSHHISDFDENVTWLYLFSVNMDKICFRLCLAFGAILSVAPLIWFRGHFTRTKTENPKFGYLLRYSALPTEHLVKWENVPITNIHRSHLTYHWSLVSKVSLIPCAWYVTILIV